MPMKASSSREEAVPAVAKRRLDRDARRRAEHGARGSRAAALWKSSKQGSETTAAFMPSAASASAASQAIDDFRAGRHKRDVAPLAGSRIR